MRQIDLDGKHEYSNVIKIASSKDGVMQIFPNPTQNILNVKDLSDECQYSIINMWI